MQFSTDLTATWTTCAETIIKCLSCPRKLVAYIGFGYTAFNKTLVWCLHTVFLRFHLSFVITFASPLSQIKSLLDILNSWLMDVIPLNETFLRRVRTQPGNCPAALPSRAYADGFPSCCFIRAVGIRLGWNGVGQHIVDNAACFWAYCVESTFA